jgi:RNA polymerase sigma factor (sigma-70 family)
MPSDEELAEILSKGGVEVESNSQLVAHKTILLDDVIDEEGTTLAEVGEVATATAIRNEVEDVMDAEQNAHDAEKLLSVLPVRERTILEMAFGIGYDMEYDDAAIANKIGISDERVRQLKIKALKTLKERGRAILSA